MTKEPAAVGLKSSKEAVEVKEKLESSKEKEEKEKLSKEKDDY